MNGRLDALTGLALSSKKATRRNRTDNLLITSELLYH